MARFKVLKRKVMTKLLTETYTLPAYWGPYLINGDSSGMEDEEEIEVKDWLKAHPWLGDCLDMQNEDEFSWENDANDVGGAVADFVFTVTLTRRSSNGLDYLIYPATPVVDMLPWQKAGRTLRATGYGSKIPTTKVLYLFGRRYRIYCDVYSNAASTYIIYQGGKVYL